MMSSNAYAHQSFPRFPLIARRTMLLGLTLRFIARTMSVLNSIRLSPISLIVFLAFACRLSDSFERIISSARRRKQGTKREPDGYRNQVGGNHQNNHSKSSLSLCHEAHISASTLDARIVTPFSSIQKWLSPPSGLCMSST
jgi:hypothetical protein